MKTNKIAILTFHNTVNYGAMLQTYALYRYLRNNGVHCEVLDYKNAAIERVERPLKLFSQRSLKGVIKYFKCGKAQRRKWARFERFRRENVALSERSYTRDTVFLADDEYSAFIVGSDQVWNTELTDTDLTYYLDFVTDNSKKHSYAASFGFSEWQGDPSTLKQLLLQFSSLNVREQSAKRLIGDSRVNVVCDPTLLLPVSEWEQLALNDTFSDCIVVYMIDFRKEVFDFVRELSQKTGCKTVYVHDAIRSQKGMVNSRDHSVEDFISMIKNARFVVTGSFHAVCMSLLFQKQFYYTLNSKSNKNSRLENLLEKAGLIHRTITDASGDIDYAQVNLKLYPYIENSKRILDEMLKG